VLLLMAIEIPDQSLVARSVGVTESREIGASRGFAAEF
jgi:hypothetical protein